MTESSAAGDERPWSWDPSLYRGSARYYALGRVAYPAAVADTLVTVLALDGSGRLLDVGCGPGSLTLLLAPHVGEAIGIDADADMLAEAERLARKQGVTIASWRRLRAEDLPGDLPPVRVATLAQSFHWMDRPRVAAAVRTLLDPGGALVHVGARTDRGVDDAAGLPHPRPPWRDVDALARRHLGPVPRAGQGVRPTWTPEGEEAVYRGAGFSGPERFVVPGAVVTRSVDEVVASVFSLSSSAPHLFGTHLPAFEAELRGLLADVADHGLFSEQMPPTVLDVWR